MQNRYLVIVLGVRLLEEGASSQKDITIATLQQASLERLEKEKHTWQAMLGCQMSLDIDKFGSLMRSFGGGSSGSA